MDGNVARGRGRPGALEMSEREAGDAPAVFVVSMDMALRGAIARALSETTARVMAADSLEQLSSHLQGDRPVVVFDAGTTGEEPARRLLSRHPAVRIVYLTLDPFVSLGTDRARYLMRPLVAANLAAGVLRSAVASLRRG
jgi:hypothetical protein